MTRLASYSLPQSKVPFPHSSVSKTVQTKNIGRLRLNWFVMGAAFGAVVSFMMQQLGASFATWETSPQPGAIIELDTEPQPLTPIDELAQLDASDAVSVEQALSVEDSSAVSAPSDEVADIPAIPEILAEMTVTAEADEREPNSPQHIIHRLKRGDTLATILTDHQVPYSEAHKAVQAMRKAYNPRNLRPGHELNLELHPHTEDDSLYQLSSMRIDLNGIESVMLTRLEEGGFAAEKVKAELQPALTLAGGTITNSLFETGSANGIPNGVLAELVKAYSYDVDFQREIHRGDQVEVLFDRMLTEDGDEAGYGDIHYAQLKLRGEPIRIFRYQDKDGVVGFYDENGESIVKALLKTPVDGARISSGYGMRRHPVLGYNKMHKGTDFAAPTGTPIFAAGDGVVERQGWVGGYGNYIKIRHNDTYSTAYGHMHRFGKGMKKGARVKQGQIIGYVGSTGRSTGPHLHYEVHKHGRQVNPMAERFKAGRTLKGKELAQFKDKVVKIEQQVASMPRHSTTVASSH